MKESIRVLQVIGSMNRGGAETLLMNLYRQIDKTKIQFDFVENIDRITAFDAEIESMGGRIYRCPHYNGKNYFQYKKWWKDFFQIHKDEYRIVHGHIGSTAAIYLGEAKKHGIFTIAHSHNSGTDYSIQSLLYRAAAYPTRYIADYFFACSEIAGLDRYGKKVVQSENYMILHNAIDTSSFIYNPEEGSRIKREFGIENQKVIGHIGRFNTQKNHRFLIRIFREIQAKDKNTVLLMVGDGNLRLEIEQLAREYGIVHKCIFTGVREDISCLMSAMDILVFPSLYEGLPVTMVEAQTSGLLSVISDKVPSESVLVDDLITIMKLSDSTRQWAEHILERLSNCLPRRERSAEVMTKGYDIVSTSKWLEEFYIERYKSYKVDSIYSGV